MVQGVYNRMMIIDVSRKSFEIKSPENGLLSQTLGGKGLATHLLLKNNPPRVDPLSPDNHLIFACGPVTASPVWGSCRYGVYTKSPQTGCFSESYSGGTVAEHMAGTGFDIFMIKGAAAEPVWIEINETGAVFHPAGNLRGLDTYSAEEQVKTWIKENRSSPKGCGVVCIGPAGENQVCFAVIENDKWRSAGRTGTGAVMGSKNIKAIAFTGKCKKQMANPGLIKDFSRSIAQRGKSDSGAKAYKKLGTPMMVDVMNAAGSFPTRYWHKDHAEFKDRINAGALHERLSVTPSACRKCFMACGRLATVKAGRHAGLTIEGPEYETIGAFGGLCEVDSIEEIAFLNDLCDRLGLDTMTAGNLAAFTIEASRQGRIDYTIDYGQVDRIAELLEDTAYRRGIGATLARGIKEAAREWHMEDQAIHVKGLEPAAFDPRVLKGMGLAYASSPRGACHLRATFYKPELSKMIDPDQIEGKAEMFAAWEDRLTIFDTLILCRFYRDMYQWEELQTMIKGCTGLDLRIKDMRRIAAGISDRARVFNLREGVVPADDRLPERFYTEKLGKDGKIIRREHMQKMLSDYYRARGWGSDGLPHENHLHL